MGILIKDKFRGGSHKKLGVPGSMIREQEGVGSIIQRTSREHSGQVLGNIQRAFSEQEGSGSVQVDAGTR